MATACCTVYIIIIIQNNLPEQAMGWLPLRLTTEYYYYVYCALEHASV